MVWMAEGGSVVPPRRCVSSPFRRHLARGEAGDKPVPRLPRAALTSPCCAGRERGSGAAQDARWESLEQFLYPWQHVLHASVAPFAGLIPSLALFFFFFKINSRPNKIPLCYVLSASPPLLGPRDRAHSVNAVIFIILFFFSPGWKGMDVVWISGAALSVGRSCGQLYYRQVLLRVGAVPKRLGEWRSLLAG